MAENNPELLKVLSEVGDNHIEIQDIEKIQNSSKTDKIIEGDEGEIEIFQSRCKLHWFSDGKWYVHAVGDLRVLKPDNQNNGTKFHHRVIMRREDVLNLAINHHILAETNPSKEQPKCVMWRCTDFSHPDDGDAGFNKTVMARFKTEEDADLFLKILKDNSEVKE